MPNQVNAAITALFGRLRRFGQSSCFGFLGLMKRLTGRRWRLEEAYEISGDFMSSDCVFFE
jgi:hypothetical protein